jgi:hypothetical protein
MSPSSEKLRKVFVLSLVILFFFPFSSGIGNRIGLLWAANLTVKAVVSPRLHMTTIFQKPEIIVTLADLRKGYVEVKEASIFEVESNCPEGYLLAFQGSLGPYQEIHVQGLSTPLQLESNNALIHQPYSDKKKETFSLSYRLILRPEIDPGTYAWPYIISVQPLENWDRFRKKRKEG